MSVYTFNPNIPAASDPPTNDQAPMLQNFSSTNGIVAVDHVGFNVTNGGYHKQCTFPSNNVPSPVGGSYPFASLFTNAVGSINQPFFYGNGTTANTSGQYTLSGTSGSTYFWGGIIAKWFNIASLTAAGGPFNYTSFGLQNFPNAVFVAFLTNGSLNFSTCVSALSTSTITIGKSPTGGTTSVNVFVLGY